MAIQKNSDSRQSVDLKWKLRKTLEKTMKATSKGLEIGSESLPLTLKSSSDSVTFEHGGETYELLPSKTYELDDGKIIVEDGIAHVYLHKTFPNKNGWTVVCELPIKSKYVEQGLANGYYDASVETIGNAAIQIIDGNKLRIYINARSDSNAFTASIHTVYEVA